MNVVLFRYEATGKGIFGTLNCASPPFLFQTLERAYNYPSAPMLRDIAGYEAKVPPGTYTCKRGPHRLASMKEDFETFEVMGVPGHTGILFHVGNYNEDSNGCILLGASREGNMLKASRTAFAQFLEATKNVNEFTLRIE